MSGRSRLVAWAGFVLAFSAISYSARFAAGTPSKDVLYTWAAAAQGAVQYALVLAIVLAISRPDSRRLLALRRPRSWARGVGLGLTVIFGTLLLGGVLSPFLDPGKEQGLLPEGWEPDRAAAFAANVAIVTLAAPLVEELTFRGLGFSLLEPFGRWTAILLVGLAFAVAHGLVQGLPLLAAFGAGLAYIRDRTDSVFPGMLAHAAFNALALTAAVTT